MHFAVRHSSHSVEAVYTRCDDDPLFEPREYPNPPKTNEVYRIGVTQHCENDDFTFLMQHLFISAPPYSHAASPGRLVSMTFEQLSAFIDALVEYRDKVRP